MADIFLSYANADRERIRPLVKILEERGWSVWWDRKIPPGKTWHYVIQQAIDEAKCVVVIWSQQSIQSEWVITEAEEGKERQALIPVLIDNVKAPLAFRRIQAARLVDWNGESSHHELGVLIEAIESIAGRPEKAREEVQFEQNPGKTTPSSVQGLETPYKSQSIAQGGIDPSLTPTTQRPVNISHHVRRIADENFDDISGIPRPHLVTPNFPPHFDSPTEGANPELIKVFTENVVVSDNATDARKLRVRLGVAILVTLVIGGLVISATTYLKQRAEERVAQQQAQVKSKVEKQNQKDGLIGNLRDRIAEINKRIQALNKQSLKGKRDAWSESLNKLSQRLDGVSNISSEQSQEINQACDEIGKELSKIEEEINNVQG